MSACYRCGSEISSETAGARAVCERCGAYAHCCRNCEFYEPGAHHDCREPNVEPVADKEQGNFCDYFRLSGRTGGASTNPAANAKAKLDALFRRK
jgi:hypothetical protein